MISAWIIFKPKTHGTKQETLRGAEEGGEAREEEEKEKKLIRYMWWFSFNHRWHWEIHPGPAETRRVCMF